MTQELSNKTLANRITKRMDELQQMMDSNKHLETPELVEAHIQTVSKFWSVLSEEDRDYIHGARYAIEEKIKWEV